MSGTRGRDQFISYGLSRRKDTPEEGCTGTGEKKKVSCSLEIVNTSALPVGSCQEIKLEK